MPIDLKPRHISNIIKGLDTTDSSCSNPTRRRRACEIVLANSSDCYRTRTEGIQLFPCNLLINCASAWVNPQDCVSSSTLAPHAHQTRRLSKGQCRILSKGFTWSSTPTVHTEAMYQGVRPLACMFCEQRFLHQNHLTIHMRRHTGERPFQRGICGKIFSRSDALKRHNKAVHIGGNVSPVNYAVAFTP